MPYTPPVSSDINFNLVPYTPAVSSDINFDLDPLVNFSLTVANATQAQTADNVTLAVKYALTVASATQTQNADNATLSVKYALTVDDVAQAQAADNVSLKFNAPAGGDTGSAGWMAVAAYNRELYRLREVIEQEQDDEEVMAILYG